MERTDTDQRSVVSRTTTTAADVSRYDVALGVIPLFLGLPALGALVADLPLEPLVGVGAVACAFVVADVLFVHPPDVGRGVDGVGGGCDDRRRRRRRTG